MNCREFEEQIYLYEELNSNEKKTLDEHSLSCLTCSQLRNEIVQSKDLIKQQIYRPELKNPDVLTQRILKAIATRETRPSLIETLLAFANRFFVRYAFATISILLVSFFIYEELSIDQKPAVHQIISEGALLEMNEFRHKYHHERTSRLQASRTSRFAFYISQKNK